MNTETQTKPKLKTVFCMRIRLSDSEPWGETEYFRTRKARDHAGSVNRIIGGIRTHSFEEKKTAEQISELLD